jgi:LemA protein
LQVEDYPDLLANTQFTKLMDGLSIVEDELAMARRYYNGTVRDLHNRMEVFPNVLFVGISGVKKKSFYEINASEAVRPEINLNE